MTGIVDYGVGNLFSLQSSFSAIGEEAFTSKDEKQLKQADRLILPGVGAFRDAAKKLKESGLDQFVLASAKKGVPILGICLGMQLLFDKSYEYGEYEGLSLIPGEVVPMEGRIPSGLKIPHIGWNPLIFKKDSVLFRYIKEGDCTYFVHSYFADNCAQNITSAAEYGIELTASVEKDNIFGCQFHPEKSGDVGLNILRAFTEIR